MRQTPKLKRFLSKTVFALKQQILQYLVKLIEKEYSS